MPVDEWSGQPLIPQDIYEKWERDERARETHMTNPDWTTPDTDGWHWLRWKGERPAYLGFYSHLREYWIVYAMNGVSGEYPPESVARLFDYIGPIPEPATFESEELEGVIDVIIDHCTLDTVDGLPLDEWRKVLKRNANEAGLNSQARLVECLKNTLVLAEARIESMGEYVDEHPTVIEARALIKENGYE